jgi:putative transposase
MTMAGHAGKDVAAALSRWQVAAATVREQMYQAPTARERERWHAVWLALQGWSAAQVAAALGRDPHTVGQWLAAFRRGGPAGLTFRHTGGPAPALTSAQQAALKAAVQRPPREAGMDVASWHWKVVRRFVRERFGVLLGRSSCRAYLHRLGFVVKRPKKRLLKAKQATRTAFVAAYAALRREAKTSGAKIFFVDEAHFYADGDLRRMWVLKGTPALVDSTSPRYGEKASYYSAICLETGEVEVMPLEGTSSAATSAAFLQHLRARQDGPLVVIWDNASVHGGAPLRDFLRTPTLRLRVIRLPAYSPDFNADEHIWGWMREEVTANTCFGTAAKVRAQVDRFFTRLAALRDEVMQRCRTELQTQADAVDALLATASHSEAVRKAA